MLYEAQPVVAVTGTAVQVSATRAAATWVNIQAGIDNNAAGMTVGGSDVTGPEGARPGVILLPGQSLFLPQVESPSPYNLQDIYINGTANDEAEVLYFKR
jgi:hypothetical protein